MEIRIVALDDSFYLDEEEAESYFYPSFLQEKYLNNLKLIFQTIKKLFDCIILNLNIRRRHMLIFLYHFI